MTPEQMESAIQFLLDSQARFYTDLEMLKESVQAIGENQKHTDTQIQALAENAESQRLEMRDAFDKLILANEVTRELAVQIGNLVVQTSQRITKLEEQNGKQ